MPVFISPLDLEKVRDAHDLSDLKVQVQEVITHLGFDRFMYLVVWHSTVASTTPQNFFFGTFPSKYVSSYEQKRWFCVDPGFQHIIKCHVPLIWKREDFANPHAISLLEAAINNGVGAGAFFPIISSSLATVGMTIALDSEPDAVHEQCQQMLPFGCLLSCYVHSAVTRLLNLPLFPSATSGITSRERECLHLAAQGMRDAEIARELNITTRTVISHLSSARQKLQAENRAQMIARAMALKVINL